MTRAKATNQRALRGVLLAAALVAGGGQAQAIPEVEIEQRFAGELVPGFAACPKESFAGVNAVQIVYRVCRTPAGQGISKGSVVLIPGYSESAYKYSELIYDLRQAGYNVYTIDLRGMGESQRLTANPQMGYVDSFQDYADDVGKFVTTVVQPQAPAPLYLFAHSAGGMVAAMVLAQHPGLFQGAVLSSPMLGLNLSSTPLPRWLLLAIATVATKVGLGDHYAPGSTDYDPKDDVPSASYSTHSLARATATARMYQQLPQLRVWGLSYAWVHAALVATGKALQLAPAVTTPVLILAADEDVLVDPAASAAFCAQAPDCHYVRVEHARHEVFQEVDAVRAPLLLMMTDFFAAKHG